MLGDDMGTTDLEEKSETCCGIAIKESPGLNYTDLEFLPHPNIQVQWKREAIRVLVQTDSNLIEHVKAPAL